jgi:hypothetical protein
LANIMKLKPKTATDQYFNVPAQCFSTKVS